ncbi:MAG: sialidase family protein, partial [Ignavibacteriales bacterium]
MYKFTALLIIVLLIGFSLNFAQDARNIVAPKTVVSGNEVGQPVENVQPYEFGPITFSPVNSGQFTWTVNNISALSGRSGSGYDLQSNGSTQQVWYDLNNPGYVHSVFTYSAVDDNAWADRTCLYFGSTDGGTGWFELGGVPVNNGSTGRSGFPSIIGTSDGRAVISNHNNASTPTRSTVFVDNSPFEYSFTNNDPGATPFGQGEAIWPKLAINSSDVVALTASINGGDSFYVNTLNSGVFSGWQPFNGDQAETYSLNYSDGGKLALVWIGGIGNDGDVSFTESTDNGSTWSTPIKIFEAIPDPVVVGDIYGPIRGVDVNYFGEEAVVVFEAGWQTDAGSYYPGRESDIRFWRQSLNGGVPTVIADSNNVPFYANYGVADVMWNMGRPVVGRSQDHDYLLVAFQATNGEYWPGASAADSTAFFQGMFTHSTDGGATWSVPEVFTPASSPTVDFRHPSIVPIHPVTTAPDDDIITVHISMQGDPMPASTANGWGIMPPSVTAEYYHFTTEILVPVAGVGDDVFANSFDLEQNYPNPFNPSTTINYTL